MKRSAGQGDYSITVFSRRKGKTRSFNLSRHVFYVPLFLILLLVTSSLFYADVLLQERAERQRLQKRILQLEQLGNRLQLPRQRKIRAHREEGEPSSPQLSPPAAPVAEEKPAKTEAAETRSRLTGVPESAQINWQAVAKIEDPRASFLPDGSGFKFEFKLINQASEPISGYVAIVALLKEPHTPRYLSYPSMDLINGMPVELKKSVGFYIRRFKYMTGKFDFPFDYAESFRLFIYDLQAQMLFDATVPVGEVDTSRLRYSG